MKKKYLVFPKGYDPLVATSVCEPWDVQNGVTWTPEDTLKMQELAKQAKVYEVENESELPIGLWHQETTEEDMSKWYPEI